MSRTTRTFEATITNQQQVRDDLDQLGWAASKLWNVGRYYAQEQWDETGEIPDDGELKAELKGHERYTDLHFNPVSAFSKNSLKRSTAGSASVGTATTVPDHPDTARTETPIHAPLCRSKRLASSTTHSSPVSASRKAVTSKNTVQTSSSASTRLARTLT